jgi:hypothetical protein
MMFYILLALHSNIPTLIKKTYFLFLNIINTG